MIVTQFKVIFSILIQFSFEYIQIRFKRKGWETYFFSNFPLFQFFSREFRFDCSRSGVRRLLLRRSQHGSRGQSVVFWHSAYHSRRSQSIQRVFLLAGFHGDGGGAASPAAASTGDVGGVGTGRCG